MESDSFSLYRVCFLLGFSWCYDYYIMPLFLVYYFSSKYLHDCIVLKSLSPVEMKNAEHLPLLGKVGII